MNDARVRKGTKSKAYKESYLQGWNKAWVEYYTSLAPEAAIHVNQPILAGNNNNNQTEKKKEEEEDAPKFEVAKEWVEFFARNAALRKAELERQAREEEALSGDSYSEAEIELGGKNDSLQRARVEKLYGERSDEVLRAEARLNATFQTISARRRAPFWPVLPLNSYNGSNR